ncbi:MAG TPA: alpha-L-rhamnosidase, partial [Clostridia bacterium]|nr:alpha-L-rhamnosidase [Clostridia bacterium]
MLKTSRLKCEYLKNPIGIGESKPRFGWILESGGRDIVQETYHLQVATDKSFANLVWDTGVVDSSESVHVAYQGEPLKPSTEYFYRVKISDNDGNASPWSDTAFFQTSMSDASDWKAQFISPEEE